MGTSKPQRRYADSLHRISRRARLPQNVRFVVDTVEAQDGAATLLGKGRSEKRILREVRDNLPEGYHGEFYEMIPSSPVAEYRRQVRQVRLCVRRAELVPNEIGFGHPQAKLFREVGAQLDAARR